LAPFAVRLVPAHYRSGACWTHRETVASEEKLLSLRRITW